MPSSDLFNEILKKSLKDIENSLDKIGNRNQGNYTSVTIDNYNSKKEKIAMARAKVREASIEKASLQNSQQIGLGRPNRPNNTKRNEPIPNHKHYDSKDSDISYGEQQRQLHIQSKAKYIPMMIGLGIVLAILIAVGLSQ